MSRRAGIAPIGEVEQSEVRKLATDRAEVTIKVAAKVNDAGRQVATEVGDILGIQVRTAQSPG